MRLLGTGAVAGIAAVAILISLSFGAAAGAEPTPTASGAAPITVIIPGASSGGGSGGGGGGGGLPTLPEPGCVPGTNPDGSPVPPAQPATDAAVLKLDKDRVLANGWVVATASGYQPNEKAQLVMYPGPRVIGSYTVDAAGEFSARFRIPENTPTGVHVIMVAGWVCGYVTKAEITVISAPGAANWLALWWVYIVLGVLFLGFLSLGIAFRSDIARWFGRGQGA